MQDMEQLVRAVTQQVLNALKQENKLPDAQSDGKAKTLVLGDTKDIPLPLRKDTVLLGGEDHEKNQNILRYSRVIITELSLTDLADLAVGRPGSPVTCAVCQALLQGVEVLLLESALSWRCYAGKASTGLCRVLEGHVNTLQTFGIKLVQSNSALLVTQAPEKKAVACKEVTGVRVLTEELAAKLARDAQELVLPAGVIVTPSALDVLKAANTTLIRK